MTPNNGGHNGLPATAAAGSQVCGKNKRRNKALEISIVLLSWTRNPSDHDFLVRQIPRHFEGWASGIKGSTFLLQWVGGRLVLTTQCLDLVQQWYRVEREYVRYMLDDDFMLKEVPENVAA